MSTLADRLEKAPFIKGGYPVHVTCSEDELREIVTALRRAEELRKFVFWVESWVSNPVGAYSVSALDGLFGLTRDRIAALTSAEARTTAE